jgi:hypothetical protein
MVCPVLVGAGKRFFENRTTTTLKQVGIEQFPRGVIALTYVPSTSRQVEPSHSSRTSR